MVGADERFRPRKARFGDKLSWLIDGRLCATSDGDPSLSMAVKDLSDVEGRVRRMDQLGIDVQVIYPSTFNHFYTAKPEVDVTVCKAYNTWLGNASTRSKGRLRWVALLPYTTMPDALDQLRESRANGACGVFMRPVEGNRQPADPYFDPVYALAAELDMPICIHTSNGNAAMNDVLSNRWGNHYFLAISPLLGAFVNVVTFGLPARFPTLRFGFVEAGADWLPYLLKEAKRRERMIGTAEIGEPSRTLRDQRIFVACRTDDDLPYVLPWSGEENLIFGTDFGHTDAATEVEGLQELSARTDISAEAARKIAGENARRFYAF